MLNLKILRLTAWLLLLATLISLFSGFFAAKPFLAPWINSGLALKLHLGLMLFLFILLFYLHSLTGIFHLLGRHENLRKSSFKIIAGLLWTGIILLLIYCFIAQYPADANTLAIQNLNQATTVPSSNLTLAEIAKHNSGSSCWMIIDNKVYDFTNYLNQHPGSARTMLPYCGQDGTQGYTTKDKGQPHSSYANTLLQQYYIGDLNK
ncbi:MAG: cytochrome b5-like heme/steroid binding domain-containing protein [Candidatus Parcubacteria bacterium]|nr:cytochrome b5-like heme/steroid binding domain-containing protein [Candidatus Parcubacteria bacterium]